MGRHGKPLSKNARITQFWRLWYQNEALSSLVNLMVFVPSYFPQKQRGVQKSCIFPIVNSSPGPQNNSNVHIRIWQRATIPILAPLVPDVEIFTNSSDCWNHADQDELTSCCRGSSQLIPLFHNFCINIFPRTKSAAGKPIGWKSMASRRRTLLLVQIISCSSGLKWIWSYCGSHIMTGTFCFWRSSWSWQSFTRSATPCRTQGRLLIEFLIFVPPWSNISTRLLQSSSPHLYFYSCG